MLRKLTFFQWAVIANVITALVVLALILSSCGEDTITSSTATATSSNTHAPTASQRPTTTPAPSATPGNNPVLNAYATLTAAATAKPTPSPTSNIIQVSRTTYQPGMPVYAYGNGQSTSIGNINRQGNGNKRTYTLSIGKSLINEVFGDLLGKTYSMQLLEEYPVDFRIYYVNQNFLPKGPYLCLFEDYQEPDKLFDANQRLTDICLDVISNKNGWAAITKTETRSKVFVLTAKVP